MGPAHRQYMCGVAGVHEKRNRPSQRVTFANTISSHAPECAFDHEKWGGRSQERDSIDVKRCPVRGKDAVGARVDRLCAGRAQTNMQCLGQCHLH